jgi:hypothetical protein
VKRRVRTKGSGSKYSKHGSMGLKKDVVSEQFKGKKKKDLNILHRAENIARIRSMALKARSGC